jgi:hypothetical protein
MEGEKVPSAGPGCTYIVNVNRKIKVSQGSALSFFGNSSVVSQQSESWGVSQLEHVVALTTQEWLLEPSRVVDAVGSLSWLEGQLDTRTLVSLRATREFQESKEAVKQKCVQVVCRHGVDLCKKRYNVFERRSFQEEHRRVDVKLGAFPVGIFKAHAGADSGTVGDCVSLESLGERKRVLLVASAGLGKSLLCLQICQAWSRGHLWRDVFDCVVFVDLVKELAKKSRLVVVEDLVFSVVFKAKEVMRNVSTAFSQWLTDPARRVMWILDGYDEVEHQLKGTVFEALKDNHNDTFANVIIATRPEITSGPDRMMDQREFERLEVTGFSDNTVDEYIVAYFNLPTHRELLVQLRKALDFLPREVCSRNRCRPRSYVLNKKNWIKEAVRIPLMLELVCAIFEETRSLDDLSRKTTIYEKVIELWLRGNGKRNGWWKRDWDSDSKMKKAWKALCRVAWLSRSKGSLVRADLTDCKATKWAVRSGLLTLVMNGPECWVWKHASFQEFLAAKWACTHLEPATFCNELALYKRNEFWTFVCGVGGRAMSCLTDWFSAPVNEWLSYSGMFAKDPVWLMWVEECSNADMALMQAFWQLRWPQIAGHARFMLIVYAASRGLTRTTKVLIGAGANSCAAFHFAAENGCLDILRWIVEREGVGMVNVPWDGITCVLAIAALNGHLNVVKFLLGCNADVNAVGAYGQSVLEQAVWGGNLEIVQLLLGQGAIVSNKCLQIAVEEGFDTIVAKLFAYCNNINKHMDVNS